MKKAIFLDRDGTLNIEKEYLYQEKDLEFIPGTIEALHILRSLGYLLIVVTNQSGIARGYYTEEDLALFHQAFQKQLQAQGEEIDAYYYCPHHPEKGIGQYKKACHCRKPEPGMLEAGLEELGIEGSQSYMVGDKAGDVRAGIRAGLTPVLVRTGYGVKAEKELEEGEAQVFPRLLDFAKYLEEKEGQR